MSNPKDDSEALQTMHTLVTTSILSGLKDVEANTLGYIKAAQSWLKENNVELAKPEANDDMAALMEAMKEADDTEERVYQ